MRSWPKPSERCGSRAENEPRDERPVETLRPGREHPARSARGKPNRATGAAAIGVHNGDLEAIACPLLLSEFRDGLEKPHFRAALNKSEAHEAIDAYSAVAVMFSDPTSVEQVLRDDEDDYLLALARSSDAEASVTGDKDLLDHPGLHPPAIDARSAWKLIQAGESSSSPA